jgi:hypothetical protein
MKINLYFLIAFFNAGICLSQFGPQQIITNEAMLARAVFTADIDGDGDKDVLTASRSIGDFNIAWFENLDGLGNFGAYNLIDNDLFDQAYSVYAADLDNDGDMDVLATALSDDQVLWYENLDGLGYFGPKTIIASNINGAYSVIAADLDNDGDMDVISSSDFDNKIAWFKNDGLGSFGNEQIISLISNGKSVITGDLDNDGDLDIVFSSSGDDIVFWAENIDGLGNFSTPISIAPVSIPTSTSSVFAIDIDEDDYLDVLAIPFNEHVVWYKNLDGQGNFSEEQVIVTNLSFAVSVFSTDLDNDGDNDVFFTTSYGATENTGEVAWCENLDGLGNFGTKQIIINTLTSPRKVYACDIDNDGDEDVFSVSQNDNTIAWYENLTILGVEEESVSELALYPNPVKNTLNFNPSNKTPINKIAIYNSLGSLVVQNNNPTNSIDISKLSSGILFVKIETDQGIVTKKIIKE